MNDIDTNAKHLPTESEIKAFGQGLKEGRLIERRELLEWIQELERMHPATFSLARDERSFLLNSIKQKLEGK